MKLSPANIKLSILVAQASQQCILCMDWRNKQFRNKQAGMELLSLLNFRLNVSSSVFQRYYSHMEMEISQNCVIDNTLNAFSR
jgi:hypothetical protein